jgi:hypothetical protein
MERHEIESACPNCGTVARRETYDIGSGPELACANCEWCWGAEGQALKPLSYQEIVESLGFDPLSRITAQRMQAASQNEGRERPLITVTPETTMLINHKGIMVSLDGLRVSDDLGLLQEVDVRQGEDLMRGVVKEITPTGSIFIEVDWDQPIP